MSVLRARAVTGSPAALPLVAVSACTPDVENRAAAPSQEQKQKQKRTDCTTEKEPPVTVLRMDNVAIVVDDLAAATAFFIELGLELEGEAQVEGAVPDRMTGLDGVRSAIAMLRTPDGHSRLELTKFLAPAAVGAGADTPPPNTLGLHRVMFAVDDLDDTVARLRLHGAELLGGIAQYEDAYRLCDLRGPSGIIVALAERLG